MRLACIVLAGISMIAPAVAQESPSYRLTEYVLNAAGNPASGATLTSTGYRMTLHSLGECLSWAETSSPGYFLEAGFTATARPPGEVRELRFASDDSLFWEIDPGAATYNLYRDRLGTIRDLRYGSCEQSGLTGALATDPETPPSRDGFFYLVTATNRLLEEGGKGFDSGENPRGNATPCPGGGERWSNARNDMSGSGWRSALSRWLSHRWSAPRTRRSG